MKKRKATVKAASVIRTANRLSKQNSPKRGRSGAMSIKNAYESAQTARRLTNWRPGMLGPNAAVLRDLNELRNRSRDLARNNPWISRGLNSWVANEIGTGITFKAMSPDADFNKQADDLWEEQTQYFDADGREDFHGLLAKIVRTRREAGEIFIRRRVRRPTDGLPVPLQYQLLEPEHCPHNYDWVAEQRAIRAGIEFDAIGRRRAYWMYRRHPGDFFTFRDVTDLELVAVPASEIIHHYDPLRPGQIRGVPAIVQAMVKAKDFDEYDDAELIRKKNRAAFTGMITRPPLADDEWLYDPLTGEPVNKDAAGVPVTNIEAGQFLVGIPGEDVELFEGDNTGSGYKDFIRQQLLGIGAGQNVPYEFVSGDFSELNDRTLRVVLAEYHRVVEQDRWRLTIPQVCYVIWRDFINMAILSGALPEPLGMMPKEYQKVACHPEGWPYLHELQDANADVIRWKNGLTSRKRIAAERGEDIREIDQENQEDQQRAEQLDLAYGDDAKAQEAADDAQQMMDDEDRQQQQSRAQNFRRMNARHYAA